MKRKYTLEEQADLLNLCRDVIDLFLEYRDRHEKTEEEAKILAVAEAAEALGAVIDEA